MLDAMEAAGNDEDADRHGGDRDADVKRYTGDLEPGGDARELGSGRAEVGDDRGMPPRASLDAGRSGRE